MPISCTYEIVYRDKFCIFEIKMKGAVSSKYKMTENNRLNCSSSRNCTVRQSRMNCRVSNDETKLLRCNLSSYKLFSTQVTIHTAQNLNSLYFFDDLAS